MNAEEQGTVLKIEYQRDIEAAADADNGGEGGDESESDTQPFPPIPATSKKDPWRQVKKEMIESEGDSKFLKLVRSTKRFFGIDQADSKGAARRQESSDTPNSLTRSPIYQNKALTHWNERTFRVLKSNAVFGGKIKETALDRYIDSMDDEPGDTPREANAFLYFKSTGESLDLRKRAGLTDIAIDGVRKALKKKPSPEASRDEVQSRMAAPEEVFGDQPMSSLRRTVYFDHADSRRAASEVPRKGPVDEEDEDVNIPGPCDAFTYACKSKRVPGMGFCGRLCDNDLDPNKKNKYDDLLKSVKPHRSYFTFWVTFVQVVVCLVSLFAYGIAPIGFSYTTKRGLATGINLEKQLISYPVKQNFWFGPVWTDLVHLGAKYAPCMRNDTNIWKAIEHDRIREKETACCIRNDKGGCVQTTRDKCSTLYSRFSKWNASTYEASIPNGMKRSSGSVCGLDPEFCNDLESHKWPDDITQWPICEKPSLMFKPNAEKNEHMMCEIIGRPCCVGLQGECVITSLEHCSLMRGYFHQDAHLCSQVDCMQDTCGMIDFLNPKNPDQVYRLFTSIFIHAGMFQLLVTIIFQLFILRDVEKLAGCLRVAIIYTASGVIGNLGSAIFLPYQAEVGPMGSQFGIIACLFVEVFHAWEIYQNPWFVMLKLTGCLIVLILIGFLPMIDNFANVFGFLSGLLLSSILFPNINMKGRCRRILVISICISVVVVFVTALVVLFYVRPIEHCDFCKMLSCPFGKKYCLEMDFNITRLA